MVVPIVYSDTIVCVLETFPLFSTSFLVSWTNWRKQKKICFLTANVIRRKRDKCERSMSLSYRSFIMLCLKRSARFLLILLLPLPLHFGLDCIGPPHHLLLLPHNCFTTLKNNNFIDCNYDDDVDCDWCDHDGDGVTDDAMIIVDNN